MTVSISCHDLEEFLLLTGNLREWVCFSMLLRGLRGGRWEVYGRGGGRWEVWEGGGEDAQCALVNTGLGGAVGSWERKTRKLSKSKCIAKHGGSSWILQRGKLEN